MEKSVQNEECSNCSSLEEQVSLLTARVVQLEKINEALKMRVKRGMDSQGDAFALFQTATALEQKVKERTLALEVANRELQNALLKEKEMTRARDEAIDSSQLKSQFLANMSHEIRTPMNGVIGMTSLLLDTPLSEEQTDFVNIIRTSGESLLTIINDILDFSKIEAKKLVLERHPFELRTCVEEAMDLVASAASKKGLELLYFVEDSVPSIITSDITRLRQILVNLLSNAVKFTEEGEIFVSVSSARQNGERHRIQFKVQDSGIGIPEDRIGSLFTAFSQVDASTTRKYGGTGLGLAISYQLATLLGGGIRVESTLGKGSTFYVTIVAPASSSKSAGVDSELHGRKVLVVDDNATNREILKALTASWKMVPHVVESGPAMLDLCRRGHQYDVALLDFQMPEMDGIHLAQTLKANDETASLPLIMLSSISQRHQNRRELFTHWLTKPVKPQQLQDALVSLFDEGAASRDVSKADVLPEKIASAHVRILLAEDNAINQKVAVRMLDRLGYRVDVVASGVEVLRALEHIQYDIILMDVMMPEMDGIEATRQIRRQSLPLQPRIIALTANAMEEDREKCLAAGMDDYLSKPIKPEMLGSMLNRWAVTNRQNEAQVAT